MVPVDLRWESRPITAARPHRRVAAAANFVSVAPAEPRTVELDANRLRQYSQSRFVEWSVKLGAPVEIALRILFALLVLFVLLRVGRAMFPRM